MSWSYSRALVAEFSGACCSGTDPSAQLSMTHTPDQYYSHGKTTEHSRLSRFGMTCELLTEDHGEALLTWFLAASHAKTSALQEAGPDWTAKGQGCGEKWRGSLARFDPATCSLKTAQLSLVEDLTGCSPTLPRWGLMLDGDVYQQPIPVLITAEIESGFWPTPNTIGYRSDGELALLAKSARSHAEYVAMSKSACSSKRERYFPTPTVCGNYNRKGASSTSGDGLATYVKKYPTPCASASKGWSKNHNRANTDDRIDYTIEREAHENSQLGRLNPEWVEWLMGWPIGHTGLKPLETGRFRYVEPPHGKSYTGEFDGWLSIFSSILGKTK